MYLAVVAEKRLTIRVYIDRTSQDACETPVNSTTTCSDVIAYCAQAGYTGYSQLSELWRGCERTISDDERMLDILNEWGAHKDEVKFFLNCESGELSPYNNNNISKPDLNITNMSEQRAGLRTAPQGEVSKTLNTNQQLPTGVDATLSELRDMAMRQQQQIESQQKILVAKEQRLKYLRQQEQRQLAMATENERLRRLREKVEAQELKLKKLRAMRGQVDNHKQGNCTLSSELEAVRALFNEKEKELVVAVGKVDELSDQLEKIRSGRLAALRDNNQNSPAMMELERLRQELLIRNKVNEQQNSKLAEQRNLLAQRKQQIGEMDSRIHQLQDRLRKKRQLQAVQNENIYNIQHKPGSSRANVAAVEPYIKHVPKQLSEDLQAEKSSLNKMDSKYQTLPSGMKFPEETKQENDTVKPALPDHPQSTQSVSTQPTRPPTNPPTSAPQLPTTTPHPTSLGYKPSFGHSIAYKAMEDTLPLDSIPGSTNSTTTTPTTSGAPTTPGARFGINYKPTNSSIYTARPYGSTYSTAQAFKPSLMGQSTPTNSILQDSTVSASGDVFPKTSTPISSAAQSPATSCAELTAISNIGDTQEIFITGAPNVRPSDVTSSAPPARPGFAPPPPPVKVEQSQPSPASSQHSQPDSVASSGSRGHDQTDRSIPIGHPKSTSATALSKPRYASKNDIANTYTRSYNQSTMDSYQRSLSDMSKRMLGQQSKAVDDSNPPGSPTAKVQPLPTTTTTTEAGSGTGSGDNKQRNMPPPYPAAPAYIDRMQYRPHAPKSIRRRLSSGESDELGKKYQQKSGLPVNVSNPQQFTNPPTEEESTSFGHTPKSTNNVVNLENLDTYNNNGSSADEKDTKVKPAETAPAPLPKNPAPLPQRVRKGIVKRSGNTRHSRRVSFDPLALLLDASLEGELDLVIRTASEVPDPSAANDEGITALHNAICAGHYDIVCYLVEFGCNVNSPDSDGWTPLHCAASCNNLPMVRFLVEHGACIFATTISDQETAAEKCEEEDEGFDGCSEYLYNIQEKLGIINKGKVYAVFNYDSQNSDELTFVNGTEIEVLRKGDEQEQEWWWAKTATGEGYVPRNLLGLLPRVEPKFRWPSVSQSQ